MSDFFQSSDLSSLCLAWKFYHSRSIEAHTCNPSPQEAEAGELWSWSQSRLHSESHNILDYQVWPHLNFVFNSWPIVTCLTTCSFPTHRLNQTHHHGNYHWHTLHSREWSKCSPNQLYNTKVMKSTLPGAVSSFPSKGSNTLFSLNYSLTFLLECSTKNLGRGGHCLDPTEPRSTTSQWRQKSNIV